MGKGREDDHRVGVGGAIVMEHDYLTSDNISELGDFVIASLEVGWEPFGPVVYCAQSEYQERLYIQSMIRMQEESA